MYTAPAHGMAYLLADDTTKKAEYYVAAAPEGATQYVRRIYDAAGQEIYTCAPNEYPETLCGGWLLTVRCGSAASAEDSAANPAALCTDCRLVQLTTGEIRSVPDGASAFFSVTPDVYCLAGWGTAGTPDASFAILYDTHLRELKTFAGYAAMLPYTSGAPFAAQWLQLVCGADEAITACQCVGGSPSQSLLLDLVLQGAAPATPPTELYPLYESEFTDVPTAFDGSRGALAFCTYYYLTKMYAGPSVRLLSVDGCAPTDKTVADGSYPLCCPIYVALRADEPQSSPARTLYTWLQSEAGAACLRSAGYFPVSG
ncbi:MAG: hypothetical protein LKJ90_05470 [Faecalibacterium sp.]|nr:hypothetical protein [Faecalibacterium sp.]